MQTAQNVYRGLFPGSNSSYPKAPRIHIRPKWVDSLSMDIDTKPGLKAIYKASRKESPEFIAFRLEASRLMERLHQVLGHEFADVPLERLYDQLQCRLCHSQPIPCGSNGCLSSKDIAQVLSLGEWWSRLEFTAEGGPRRREERRLRIGGLLRDLVSSAFRSHSETSGNTLKKQMYLYAAHDTTLMPILATLDQTTNVPWPPYASHLTFETWQFTNGNHSRVLRIGYNGRWMNLSETHQHVSEVAIKAKLSVWTD